MDTERWLPVPDYAGLYVVSDLGNFRRIEPAVGARLNLNLRGGTMAGGYRVMTFCRGPNDACAFKAARIVASAFHGDPPSPTHQVNHKNGIRNDDRAVNLEWATPSENVRHRFDVLGIRNPRGAEHHNAILNDVIVGEIKAARANGASHGKIAATFDISLASSKAISAGRLWGHVEPTASEIAGQLTRPAGEKHHNAKVTAEIVRTIRASKESGAALAGRYGITNAAVSAIRTGKTWAHIQ